MQRPLDVAACDEILVAPDGLRRESASTPAHSALKTAAAAIVGDRDLPDDDAEVIRTLREFSARGAGVVVEGLGVALLFSGIVLVTRELQMRCVALDSRAVACPFKRAKRRRGQVLGHLRFALMNSLTASGCPRGTYEQSSHCVHEGVRCVLKSPLPRLHHELGEELLDAGFTIPSASAFTRARPRLDAASLFLDAGR